MRGRAARPVWPEVVAALADERPDLVQVGEYASTYGFVMRGATSAERAFGLRGAGARVHRLLGRDAGSRHRDGQHHGGDDRPAAIVKQGRPGRNAPAGPDRTERTGRWHAGAAGERDPRGADGAVPAGAPRLSGRPQPRLRVFGDELHHARIAPLQRGREFPHCPDRSRLLAATWFSLRFAVITALLQCLLGLALAVYLAPLIRDHGWMVAVLILPMIVAPAMMGLMYRLVLHEFAGPVPHYLYAVRVEPRLPQPAKRLLDRRRGRDAAMDALRLPALPDRLPVHPERPARGGRRGRRGPVGTLPAGRTAAHGADHRGRALHPLHRRVPGLRQHLHAGRCRAGRRDDLDVDLHLRGLLRQGDIGRAMAAAILLFGASFASARNRARTGWGGGR
jgi:ABC-type sugar transport system permease subunit